VKLSEGKNVYTKNRRNMYAKMHPKMAKYALKYTPILSVFDQKIFTQFRQRFSQENEIPNLQRPRFD